MYGCGTNTSLSIAGLELSEFPIVGAVDIDSETAGLGDVYSYVATHRLLLTRSGMWGIASAVGL